jgi:hypothetical protein
MRVEPYQRVRWRGRGRTLGRFVRVTYRLKGSFDAALVRRIGVDLALA